MPRVFVAALWLVVTVCGARIAAGGQAGIAVLHPEIREPYLGVFLSIAAGVEKEAGAQVEIRALRKDEGAAEISRWLAENRVRAVIMLGNQGLELSTALSQNIPVVVGAIQMTPELASDGTKGIGLNPDPALLMTHLRELAPKVEHIRVVYDEQRSGWLIKAAQHAARERGLKLSAIPVSGVREAAGRYKEILSEALGPADAIWLLQDSSTLDDRAILPTILNAAWDKRFVVFSSNPAHVKRGVLFSLYPDNEAMGRSLARMARDLIEGHGGNHGGMVPLRDMLLAVNVRTAAHIGLNFSRQDIQQFGLVFPSD